MKTISKIIIVILAFAPWILPFFPQLENLRSVIYYMLVMLFTLLLFWGYRLVPFVKTASYRKSLKTIGETMKLSDLDIKKLLSTELEKIAQKLSE